MKDDSQEGINPAKEQQEKPVPTVKSADRVLDIFELFAEEEDALSLMDIARKLGLPSSSTYKLLQNLHARGYLESDRQGRSFRLGYKLFEIGSKYARKTSLSEEFNRVAERIVEDLNETVFLSIRNGNKLLYIAEKQCTQPVRFVSHLGMQLPLHSTAMGKALLAGLSDEEIRRLYPSEELGMLTSRTIPTLSLLLEQLQRVRAEGLAYSEGEAVQGIRCVAAPIRKAGGEVVAAMSISIPEPRLDESLWRRAVDWVEQASREISLKLTYQSH